MEIRSKTTLHSGKNADGKAFSCKLELPVFSDEEIERFYTDLEKRIVRRAERDGYSVFSKLCVVYRDDSSFSLYIDIVFCDKRDVAGLYRVCDNRKNGVEIPFPRKIKRRGYDGFCINGNRILAFKNNFEKSAGVRRSDYLSLIEQTVI